MISFTLNGQNWNTLIDQAELAQLNEMQKLNLSVALNDLAHEIIRMVDAVSAEGEVRREVGRRMANLSSQAQAAGKMADMWTDQNSRFFKQRQLIMGKS